MGFKNAVEKAKPVLLEPIMNMEVSVPDECMGDVIGDLNSRRGKVLGMDTKGHTQVIKSQSADGRGFKICRLTCAPSPAGAASFTWSLPITKSCRRIWRKK